MAVRPHFPRIMLGATLLLLAFIPDVNGKESGEAVFELPPPAELRHRAEAAERAGDWESAFTLYCQLYITDRSATPDLREKLSNAYRRIQQLRRHRDPAYLSFTATLSPSDALTLYAELMAKVPLLYADPGRSSTQALWSHGIEEFDRALSNPVFVGTFVENPSPERIDAFRQLLRVDWAKRSVRNAREARTTLRLLLTALQDYCPIRFSSAVVIEFMSGALTGLDEYSAYLNPAMVSPELASADLTEYGLYLVPRDGDLIVEGIAFGSWSAHNTAIRKGDRIVRINGRNIDNDMDCLADAAEALRHPLGGFHEIETAPTDPDMLPSLARLPVALPSVFAAQILNEKHGIGYVRLGTMQSSTPRELESAVATLRAKGLRVLILDLRGNHGGNFLAGVEVAKRFLASGVIVSTQGQIGEVADRTFSSDSGSAAINVPLVVLIDTETASSAEVLAAALKDNHRATLIGTPTFGKGSVQYPLKLTALDNDPMTIGTRSGTVRLTIARLISPSGAAINGTGVSPHVLVPDTEAQDITAIQRAMELVPVMAQPGG